MLNKNQKNPSKKTWGGARPGAGRPKLKMDAETRKYYNAYNMQRHHAGYRNIEWHFTFERWLEWWGDDIVNRGRSLGKLVMARYGDTGPYHPDNVRKIASEENHVEAHYTKPRSKQVATPAGIFDSLTAASKHFGITVEGIRSRTKSKPAEYYYIKEITCNHT